MNHSRIRSSLSAAGSLVGGGVAALLLLVGVVLFFVPEPVTSVVGVLLVLTGVVSWLLGRLV